MIVFSFIINDFISVSHSLCNSWHYIFNIKSKRISSIKNIYAMISISLMFLVGATANSNSINSITTIDLIKVYLVLSIYILIISIMADLRDYDGDRLADIKTIPVMLGYNAGKRVIYLLFILFSILVVIENLISFYILLCLFHLY
ncbi:MAG: hypothetical protein DRO92_02275 [Candidatus Altiarchaeales archaeon]|nr:MAG: hypothetical protein DRO92_02275 [Candidatus Altiarchaeales archaeon]